MQSQLTKIVNNYNYNMFSRQPLKQFMHNRLLAKYKLNEVLWWTLTFGIYIYKEIILIIQILIILAIVNNFNQMKSF